MGYESSLILMFEIDVSPQVTPFSAHCISDHRISDQKVRTVMVRAIVRVRVRVMVWVWVRVRVRVRLGDAVVTNAVGRKVGNRLPIRLPVHRRSFVYKISTARRAVCTCVYIQIFFVHNHFVHNAGEPISPYMKLAGRIV